MPAAKQIQGGGLRLCDRVARTIGTPAASGTPAIESLSRELRDEDDADRNRDGSDKARDSGRATKPDTGVPEVVGAWRLPPLDMGLRDPIGCAHPSPVGRWALNLFAARSTATRQVAPEPAMLREIRAVTHIARLRT